MIRFRQLYSEYFNGKVFTPVCLFAAGWAYLSYGDTLMGLTNAVLAGVFLIVLEDVFLLNEEEK